MHIQMQFLQLHNQIQTHHIHIHKLETLAKIATSRLFYSVHLSGILNALL